MVMPIPSAPPPVNGQNVSDSDGASTAPGAPRVSPRPAPSAAPQPVVKRSAAPEQQVTVPQTANAESAASDDPEAAAATADVKAATTDATQSSQSQRLPRERRRPRVDRPTPRSVDLNLIKGWGALALATADCDLLEHATASRRFSRQQLNQPAAVYPAPASQHAAEPAAGGGSPTSPRWVLWCGAAAVVFILLAGLCGYVYLARHGHPGLLGLH
jgi:hypothetical protein